MPVTVQDIDSLLGTPTRKAGGSSPDIDALIDEVAATHGVDPNLVRSVVQAESNYDPQAVSPKGAQGLMQLMPKTAAQYGVKDPFNPLENLTAGTKHLKYLTGLYPDNPELVAAAYNAGEGAVGQYGGIPPYPETQAYVKKVTGKGNGNGRKGVTVDDIDAVMSMPLPQPAPPPISLEGPGGDLPPSLENRANEAIVTRAMPGRTPAPVVVPAPMVTPVVPTSDTLNLPTMPPPPIQRTLPDISGRMPMTREQSVRRLLSKFETTPPGPTEVTTLPTLGPEGTEYEAGGQRLEQLQAEGAPLQRFAAGAVLGAKAPVTQAFAPASQGGTKEIGTRLGELAALPFSVPFTALTNALIQSGAISANTAEELGKIAIATAPLMAGPEAGAIRMARKFRETIEKNAPQPTVPPAWQTPEAQQLLSLLDKLKSNAERAATPAEREAARVGYERTLASFGISEADLPQEVRLGGGIPPSLQAIPEKAGAAPTRAPTAPQVQPEAPPATTLATPPVEAKPTSPATVPERPETIVAQTEALAEGKKPAVLVPPTMQTVQTSQGTVVYDPAQVKETPEQIQDAVESGKAGEILGYGVKEKPKPGEPATLVETRGPAGQEIQTVVSPTPVPPAVTAAAEKVKPEGGTVQVTPPAGAEARAQEVVAERQAPAPVTVDDIDRVLVPRGEQAPLIPPTAEEGNLLATQIRETTPKIEYNLKSGFNIDEEDTDTTDLVARAQDLLSSAEQYQREMGPADQAVKEDISAEADLLRDTLAKWQGETELHPQGVGRPRPEPVKPPRTLRGRKPKPSPIQPGGEQFERLRSDLEASTGQQYSDEAVLAHVESAGGWGKPGTTPKPSPMENAPPGGFTEADKVPAITNATTYIRSITSLPLREYATEWLSYVTGNRPDPPPMNRLSVGALKGIVDRLAGMGFKEKAEAAPAPAPEPDRPGLTKFGTNPNGSTVYVDANGARVIFERGMRLTQPVRLIPGRQGFGKGILGPELLYKDGRTEFLTQEEIAQFGTKEESPSPRPLPGRAAEKPAEEIGTETDEIIDRFTEEHKGIFSEWPKSEPPLRYGLGVNPNTREIFYDRESLKSLSDEITTKGGDGPKWVESALEEEIIHRRDANVTPGDYWKAQEKLWEEVPKNVQEAITSLHGREPRRAMAELTRILFQFREGSRPTEFYRGDREDSEALKTIEEWDAPKVIQDHLDLIAKSPLTTEGPSPYEHADRLKKLVASFETDLANRNFARDGRELRARAAATLGEDTARLGQDPAAVDDIFDAVEVALNKKAKNALDSLPRESSLGVRIGEAERIESLIPNRLRTIEVSQRQQFSTPLPISVAAAYALDLQPGDIVTEPTAGTGNLLAPLPPGTPIKANEIDPRRAEALRLQGYDVTQEDALRVGSTGTVVTMNPPWGKYTTGKYGKPIPQTWGTPVDWSERFTTKEMRELPANGRIVSVMPTTILKDAPFLKFLQGGVERGFEKTPGEGFTLRALVKSPPGAYITRGTDVESVILVVDKGGIPDAPEPIRATPASWEEYAAALEPLSGGGTHSRVGGAVPHERPAAVPAVRPAPGRPAHPRPEAPAPRPSTLGPVAPGEPGRQPETGGAGTGGERTPGLRPGEPGAGVVAPGTSGGPSHPVGAGTVRHPEARVGEPALTRTGEDLRYSYADQSEFDAARRSGIFTPAPLRSSPGNSPHPRLIVKTRSLAGARLPELTYNPKGKLLPAAAARKSISDQQWDYGIVPALQANEQGHGFLSAADVGVGKTRIAAGVMGEWLETGQANRILYVTAGRVNIEDVKQQLNDYVGGPWPYEIIDVSRYADSKAKPGREIQPLPVVDKSVYIIDRYNLSAFTDAIQRLGPDAVVGDEAHLYKNIDDSSVGKNWLAIQRQILDRKGKFLYLTATPAVDFDDLEALIGLREWAPGGFADYKARVTGQAVESATSPAQLAEEFKRLQTRFEEVAKKAGWGEDAIWEFSRRGFSDPGAPYISRETQVDRYEQAISALTGKIEELGGTVTPEVPSMGSDSGEIGVTAQQPGRGGRRARRDVFTSFITPAEQEQIMRELAMKGKYDSVDLWRSGVEFDVQTNLLNPEQIQEYEQVSNLIRDISQAWSKFAPFDKTIRGFGPRSFFQMEAKRRMFDYRLDHAIAEAKASLARGEQPVISVINTKEGKLQEGPIPAAINQINDRLREVDSDTGEIVVDEEIPEALVARAELLEKWEQIRTVPSPVEKVLDAFGRENVALVTGDVLAKNRERMIREFQEGKRKVAFISGAGKTGISLHHVTRTPGGAEGRRNFIETDYEWSATTFKQEMGRVDRSGQLSGPKITALSTGLSGERKFLATIANRMRNLGALSKGSAESASNDKLADFELGGSLDTYAMRVAYRDLPVEIQEQFLSSKFRDPNHPEMNTRSIPQAAELRDFLLDLQFMHPDAANQAFDTFWANREQAIAAQEEDERETSAAQRTKTYRGNVLRTTDLRSDLTLFEVKDDHGQQFGILQGIITPHMTQIAPYLPQSSNPNITAPVRRYVTFQSPNEQISGLEIRHGAISPIAQRFGKTITKNLDTPEAVLEALNAGDRIPLEGKGGYVLRKRRDGLITVDGARMADRDQLTPAGASYSPAGNFFHVKPENMGRFLQRFPAKQQTVERGTAAAPEIEGMPQGQPDPSQPNFRSPSPADEADIVKRTDIIRGLEESTRVVRQGTPRRSLRGAFIRRPEVFRLQNMTDVEALAHEIGHLIQKKLLDPVIPRLSIPTEAQAKLEGMGRDLYRGRGKPASGYLAEGLAEFSRLYVENPDLLEQKVPGFLEPFEAAMRRYEPDVLDAMGAARNRLQMWREQPALAKVLSRIAPSGAEAPRISLKDRWRKLVANWEDRDIIARDIEQAMVEGRELSPDQSAYIAARMFRHVDAVVDTVLQDGPLVYGTDAERTGPGLLEILKPVHQDLAAFDGYLAARRLDDVFKHADKAARVLQGIIDDIMAKRQAGEEVPADEAASAMAALEQMQKTKEIADRESKSGVTAAVVREAIREAEAKYPTFADAAERLYDFQDAIQQYRRDAGLMSAETYEAITGAWPHFAPIEKVKDVTGFPYLRGRGRQLTAPPQRLKRYRGSPEDILSPLEVIYRRTGEAIRDVWRNEIVRRLYAIEQQSEGKGMLFEQVKESGPNTVATWIDGKRMYLRVHPDVYEYLNALGELPKDFLAAMFKPFTALLRYGVTTNPKWIVNNLFRDQWDAFVQSVGGYRPTDTAWAIREVMRRGPEYKRYLASGGAQGGLYATMNEDAVRMAMAELMKHPTVAKRILFAARHPLATVNYIAHVGEEATRLGQFERARESALSEGMSPRGAMEQAGIMGGAEATLDFRKQGRIASVVNQAVPFFAPGVNAVGKFFRTWKDRPIKTLLRGMVITAISTALWYMTKDDPRIRDLPDWERVYFWNIPINGTIDTATWEKMSPKERADYERTHYIVPLPKPFVWGQVFGTLAEILLDKMASKHPEALNRIGKSIAQGFSIPFRVSGIVPLWENAANYDSFRDRTIVPDFLEKLAPEEQYTAYTPETYKKTSRMLRGVRDVPLLGQLASPLKTQHLVEGMTGGLGRELVKLSDVALEALGGSVSPKTAKGAADLPIVGGFVARTPSGQSQAINDFYDALTKSREVMGTAKKMSKEAGRAGEVPAYIQENRPEAQRAKSLENAAREMSKLGQQQNSIRNAPNLTPEERQQKIDTVQEAKIKLATDVLRFIGERETPPRQMRGRK
jgi:hypothetical protein